MSPIQTVLTATFNSYGDRQISTPHKIDTPEPIDKKLGTVDYIHETTPCTKFGTNTRNITKIIFYLFIPFFLRLAYRSDLLINFYAR